MELKKILQTFKNRFEQKKLANAYFIHYNSSQFELDAFCNEFSKIFNISNLKSHPDFLKIEREKDENDYKLSNESYLELDKFLQYSPLYLGHKFVIFSDAHRVSDVLYNKLLKTLENPPSFITFIFLGPTNADILETIKSRTIAMTISSSQKVQSEALNFDQLSVQEINELLKKSPELEKDFIEHACQKIIDRKNFEVISKTIDQLRISQIHSVFNGQKSPRIASLIALSIDL